jgi:predicted DNA-binding transcriptional regulator AlpA
MTKPQIITPELLTLPQVAALCGVSKRTVWQWANDGISPPALRIRPGVVRYSRAAYMAWIAGGCRPGAGHKEASHDAPESNPAALP